MLPITNYFTRLFKVYQLKVTEPPSAKPTLDAPLFRSCNFWGIGARITSSSVAPPPVFPFLRHVFSIDTRSVKRRKEEKLGERKDHATWVNRHERLRRTGAAPALRPYRGMKACISCSVPRPPSQQGLGRRGGVRNHGDENQRPVFARRPGPAPRISTGSRGARHREKGFEFRGCRSSATPCKYNYLANLSHTREIPCLLPRFYQLPRARMEDGGFLIFDRVSWGRSWRCERSGSSIFAGRFRGTGREIPLQERFVWRRNFWDNTFFFSFFSFVFSILKNQGIKGNV